MKQGILKSGPQNFHPSALSSHPSCLSCLSLSLVSSHCFVLVKTRLISWLCGLRQLATRPNFHRRTLSHTVCLFMYFTFLVFNVTSFQSSRCGLTLFALLNGVVPPQATWDQVIVKALAYDSHHYHTHTPALPSDIFHHRLKEIMQNSFNFQFAVTLPFNHARKRWLYGNICICLCFHIFLLRVYFIYCIILHLLLHETSAISFSEGVVCIHALTNSQTKTRTRILHLWKQYFSIITTEKTSRMKTKLLLWQMYASQQLPWASLWNFPGLTATQWMRLSRTGLKWY